MTDTTGISKTRVQQELLIAEDAPILQKHLKSNTQYSIRNASTDGANLQLEVQIKGQWKKLTIALEDNQNTKNLQISSGKLIIDESGLKITLLQNMGKPTTPLNRQDLLKVLNLLLQPKSAQEKLLLNTKETHFPQEVILLAKFNKTQQNTLNIPALKANIPVPENIAALISTKQNIKLSLQESQGTITARIFLPKSDTPALELKIPISKLTNWLNQIPADLKIKSASATNIEVKQNNNITKLSVNTTPKINNWQTAKLTTKENITKIEPITEPIQLNLSKRINANPQNQNNTSVNITPQSNTEQTLKNNTTSTTNKTTTQINQNTDNSKAVTQINKKPIILEHSISKLVNSLKAALVPTKSNSTDGSINPNNEKALQINIAMTKEQTQSGVKNKIEPGATNKSEQINPKAPTDLSRLKGQLKKTVLNIETADNINKPVNFIGEKTSPLKNTELTKNNDLNTNKNILNQFVMEKIKKLIPNQNQADVNDLNKPKVENSLSIKQNSQTPDLNKLVNIAFSKMINPQNISAQKVRSETLSFIQPNLLTNTEKTGVIKNSIQELLISMLYAQTINHQTEQNNDISIKPQQKLDHLLQLLFPSLKAKLSNIIKETNSKPGQSLLQELGQIQQIFQQSQQQVAQGHSVNQQTDTSLNSLFQFLLPMQLPENVKQTEINLGHYKKQQKGYEDKDVWFIRLNFDLGDLGQLQAHAQLMDKNIDCTFLSSTSNLIHKAQPHISMLKQRLIEQGLSIGEISIEQGSKQDTDFIKQHSIINIKV
ncbi:flagellar hook-length control protein FliK [Pseudoalteromonas denitrificans]|uniref:Hook-length control protein FliK n=1 Tax=Pseudoalteromonas denitrificans DSM 6059 TaxID=1123010 RepID=A0A1I1HGW9_9GAMM|nr:flagellar hook-length control protein FliK [Pseudoalteromonas denitrificans]SFC22822.1 hook-length control protein FliK [Pseudoalteromonas denitrificans DSM 6059]